MHLAKGLEFRAVVVAACDDEIIPLQTRIERVADDADLEEVYSTERHLLYVACTRARDRLLVTGVEPASEFLDDLQVGERGCLARSAHFVSLTEMPSPDQQRISDQLVRLVQVFFALVLGQSLVVFKVVLLDPFTHGLAAFAWATVVYTIVASWIDWHVSDGTPAVRYPPARGPFSHLF